MAATVLFIHTLARLAPVFDEALAMYLPGAEARHIVDEPLLVRIEARGRLDPVDDERVLSHLELGRAAGAQAALVTCSTLSPCVDRVRERSPLPVLKIDEALMREAIRRGHRIAVIVTSPTTRESTRRALEQEAEQAGKNITIELRFVEQAFDLLRRGQRERHDQLVLSTISEALSSADVVLLAQASMAHLARRLEPPHQSRVLTTIDTALTALARLVGAST